MLPSLTSPEVDESWELVLRDFGCHAQPDLWFDVSGDPYVQPWNTSLAPNPIKLLDDIYIASSHSHALTFDRSNTISMVLS